jgi:hypothetical protein
MEIILSHRNYLHCVQQSRLLGCIAWIFNGTAVLLCLLAAFSGDQYIFHLTPNKSIDSTAGILNILFNPIQHRVGPLMWPYDPTLWIPV